MDLDLLGDQARSKVSEGLLQEVDGLVAHLLIAAENHLPAVVKPNKLKIVYKRCSSLGNQLALLSVDGFEEPLKAPDASFGEQGWV